MDAIIPNKCYLILREDDIHSIDYSIEDETLEGEYSTSCKPLSSEELIVNAVCNYMTDDGQLMRTLPNLLKSVLEGIIEASDSLLETENIKDNEVLIEKAFKEACKNY